MDPTCLAFAPIITVVVGVLKKMPWIARHPKIVAFVLSTVLAAHGQFGHGGAVLTYSLVQCVLALFGGAVATHEVVVKPAKALIGA